MKRSSLLFLLVIIIFFAIPSHSQIYPRPIPIRKCPDCSKVMMDKDIFYGDIVFGARHWTDGKMEVANHSYRGWLVKCPHCSALFWENEAEIVETIPQSEYSKRMYQVSGYSTPSESDYYKMLDRGPYDKKKEKYLRIRAWWATNDRCRYFKDESEKRVFSPSETKNLEILYELLDEKIRDERITKAEVARELGRFEKCISLLENLSDGKKVLIIRIMAEKKKSGVQEIPTDEPRKGPRRW